MKRITLSFLFGLALAPPIVAADGTTFGPGGPYTHTPGATIGPQGETYLETPGMTRAPNGDLYHHLPGATIGPHGEIYRHTPEATFGPNGDMYLNVPGRDDANGAGKPGGNPWGRTP